ncbi:MAG: DUF3443 family protein [Steroidobacteraceae bacterium]|jgi:hypothetical protein
MKNLKTSHWTARAWLSGMVLGAAVIAGCGGGGGGGSSTPPPPVLQNVANVTVDGDYNSFNSLFVTVVICQHGSTSNCVTVDHVTIDTGSIGLRVLANSLNTLNATFLTNLPTVTATASTDANTTGPLAECEQFGGGYTWGSVRNVDITISGTNETASNIPMQVIGDLGVSQPTCAAESVTGFQLTGYTENQQTMVETANPLTNVNLGGNGLIGVSLFQWDCLECTSAAEPQEGSPPTANLAYVVCPDMTGNNCQPTTATLVQQVANPIPSFTTDNNGFIIDMDAVTATAGSSTAVSGTMTFGIGTQTNNAIGTATTYQADPNTEPGVINTTWNSMVYDGLFDTGSSAYYFTNTTNPTIALCGTTAPDNEIYCPGGSTAAMNGAGTTLSLQATIQDYSGDASPSNTVTFSVTNPLANYTNSTIAADNIGGTVVFNYFIWGMPYFYGHKLYFGIAGIDGSTSPPTLTRTPYYAF